MLGGSQAVSSHETFKKSSVLSSKSSPSGPYSTGRATTNPTIASQPPSTFVSTLSNWDSQARMSMSSPTATEVDGGCDAIVVFVVALPVEYGPLGLDFE